MTAVPPPNVDEIEARLVALNKAEGREVTAFLCEFGGVHGAGWMAADVGAFTSQYGGNHHDTSISKVSGFVRLPGDGRPFAARAAAEHLLAEWHRLNTEAE